MDLVAVGVSEKPLKIAKKNCLIRVMSNGRKQDSWGGYGTDSESPPGGCKLHKRVMAANACSAVIGAH